MPAIGLSALLAGCAAAQVADRALGEATGSALQALGLKKPDPAPARPEPSRQARAVALRVHAAPDLNHDARQRPLSLVLRVYALRSAAAFLQLPYEAFAGDARTSLGDDLIASREVVLLPGQRYEASEPLAREAGALGVVALYQAPAPQRWRYAFDAAAAERTGVVLGAHGCALSVAGGTPLGVPGDAALLGAAPCAEGSRL